MKHDHVKSHYEVEIRALFSTQNHNINTCTGQTTESLNYNKSHLKSHQCTSAFDERHGNYAMVVL